LKAAHRSRYYKKYKRSAKRRGIVFAITLQQFADITDRDCAYCGNGPQDHVINQNLTVVASGVDRIDNAKGYSVANCISACKLCNTMKSTRGDDVYIKQCLRVAKHQRGTGGRRKDDQG